MDMLNLKQKCPVGEKKTQILKSMIQGKKSTQNTCLYFVCIHIYVIKLENMHDEEKEKQLWHPETAWTLTSSLDAIINEYDA